MHALIVSLHALNHILSMHAQVGSPLNAIAFALVATCYGSSTNLFISLTGKNNIVYKQALVTSANVSVVISVVLFKKGE